MNDLQKQLTRARVEYENGAIDGFSRQIAFKSFVDGDSVDIGIIDKPNDLVGKEFAIIL